MTKRYRPPVRLVAGAIVIGLLASGCAQPSRSLYSAQDLGIMIDTTEATVVTSRPVTIESPTAVGPVAGGVSAATVVGALAGGGGLATLATVLGGLLGAGAGYAAEKELRREEGTEYVLQTADGRMLTIVQRQDDGLPLAAGTPVLLQMAGGYSRVIEHPSIDADAPEGGWLNPDAPAAVESAPDAQDFAAPPRPRPQ